MKSNAKRWMLLLLGMLLLLLTACQSSEDLPPEPEEGVLIYAALNPVTKGSEVAILINRFNNSHEDIQIEVRDYSDEGGIQRLLTEFALGRVPDIMEMQRLGEGKDTAWSKMPNETRPEGEAWMPYRQMAQKGYLEDLWPYIENDPDLGLDSVLMPPLKASEVNGGLYMLFPEVSITTLMGPERVVGDRSGWTLEELLETFSTMPDSSTVLRYTVTRGEAFSMLCAPLLNQYVNLETGQTFDSEGFRNMLEFLRIFPDEFKTALTPEEVRLETIDRMLSGEQMLEAVTVANLWYVPQLDTFFWRACRLCRLSHSGWQPGQLFNLHGSKLSMASTCRNKEAAWEFMRPLLTRTYNYNGLSRMHQEVRIKTSVNMKNYRLGLEVDLNENIGKGARVGPLGEHIFRAGETDEEDLRHFDTLVNNTTQIFWPDDALAEIVWEAIGPCLAGDRTIDDTVWLLDNRVSLYVNEQK